MSAAGRIGVVDAIRLAEPGSWRDRRRYPVDGRRPARADRWLGDHDASRGITGETEFGGTLDTTE